MFGKIKDKISSFIKVLKDAVFAFEEVTNVYCIPCTWTISGNVYVEAQSADLAKAYVRTQKITPDIEECYCLNIKPDTEHPILCSCGNCGNEYIVSNFNIHPKCPHCEIGGETSQVK